MAAVVHMSQLLAGCVFYPTLYNLFISLFKRFFEHKLSRGDIYEISLRCVSSTQAVISCVVGVAIIRSTQDIMYDQVWLTNSYARFVVPYFYYDTWAMYRSHWFLHPEVHAMHAGRRVVHFLKNNAIMMLHHIILPVIFYPIVLFFRNGKGDFFVGVFYLFEMAVPFISARFVLVQLKLKDTVLYIVVGLMMIVAFFTSRVLIFPYLYWCYAGYRKISVSEVPGAIPIKCNLGCGCLLLLQCYWLYLMVRGAARVFYKIYMRRQKHS